MLEFLEKKETKTAQITFDTSAVDKDTAGEYTMMAEVNYPLALDNG